MNKKDARKTGLERRRTLSGKERDQKNHMIYERILPLLEKSKIIGCYVSINDEVSTEEIILYCLEHDKKICVPCMKENTLEFTTVDSDTKWKSSVFGIREPLAGELIQPEQIDLMIVPLSAYDDAYQRTGYGRGYYDSVLGRCRYKVGIAFLEQHVPMIETDPWDISLDLVISA